MSVERALPRMLPHIERGAGLSWRERGFKTLQVINDLAAFLLAAPLKLAFGGLLL